MVEAPRGTAAQWDPLQYEQFREQRAQPFRDLAAMVERHEGMRVVDLGCGTGEMTQWLHGELGAGETLGLDSSEEMLELAHPRAGDGLSFERRDIVEFAASAQRGAYDLIFSNSALQWVTAHDTLLRQFTELLAPGGQLAIQVPSGGEHPAREILRLFGREEPYVTAMRDYRRAGGTRPPDWYATELYHLGYERQNVRMQLYGHVLPEARAAVEWFKGSMLGPYRERMSAEMYVDFVAEYDRRVVAHCGEGEPYFMPFNRILMWGRRP